MKRLPCPAASRACALAVLLFFSLGIASSSFAYTPDSPEVRELLQRGLGHITTADLAGSDYLLGGRCLLALAIYKTTESTEHQRVQEAIQACIEAARTRQVGTAPNQDIYSLGLALIFLCELDPDRYSAQIKTFLEMLQERQKAHGGWGYFDRQTGDTSQTQYGVLGSWYAMRSGITTPNSKKSMEDVCLWLLRTQDPSGAWGYQGKDNGSFNRQPQDEVRHSLAAAGAGSLYICADLLGFGKANRQQGNKPNDNLPAALKRVGEEPEEVSKRVDVNVLNKGLNDANAWLSKNYAIEVTPWNYYYLYGLERYYSFRELYEGQRDPEPKWYNEGVEFLKRTQKPDGSWASYDASGTTRVDTAFAMLFLLRSTQKSIQRVVVSQGEMRAGRGLPSDLANARLDGNQVVGTPVGGDVKTLMELIDSGATADIQQLVEFSDRLKTEEEEPTGELAERLREFARDPSFEKRLLGVKALASSDNLDNVPVLIYALTDPDPRIVREARDGLRFISRKFDGFGLPDNPSPEQVQTAVQQWKQWYLSIRPDADLSALK